MKTPPIVLVFAAVDGTGGAGVIADSRAIRNASGLPLVVVTAVTAQNLAGLRQCWNLPPARVRSQFAALQPAPICAVKIGVVGNATAVVAAALDALGDIPKVWDPVLAPTAGAAFADHRQQRRLRDCLLPRASVITPNRRELAALSGCRQVAAGAHALLAESGGRVLVTDVAPGQQVRHELYAAGHNEPVWRARCRRRRGDYHGSGCLFSATLAARLAAGETATAAAQAAHTATLAAIDRAQTVAGIGRQKLPQLAAAVRRRR